MTKEAARPSAPRALLLLLLLLHAPRDCAQSREAHQFIIPEHKLPPHLPKTRGTDEAAPPPRKTQEKLVSHASGEEIPEHRMERALFDHHRSHVKGRHEVNKDIKKKMHECLQNHIMNSCISSFTMHAALFTSCMNVSNINL